MAQAGQIPLEDEGFYPHLTITSYTLVKVRFYDTLLHHQYDHSALITVF